MPVIHSDPDPASERPWFDFDIDTNAMDVGFEDANGLKNFPDRAAAASLDHLPTDSRHPISLSPNNPDELHELVVELDGTLTFAPASETPPVSYAHLGWYDPGADKWTVLEFQQET